MSAVESKKPAGRQIDGSLQLNAYHAREIAALKAAHANAQADLKARYEKKIMRLEGEIIRLEKRLQDSGN